IRRRFPLRNRMTPCRIVVAPVEHMKKIALLLLVVVPVLGACGGSGSGVSIDKVEQVNCYPMSGGTWSCSGVMRVGIQHPDATGYVFDGNAHDGSLSLDGSSDVSVPDAGSYPLTLNGSASSCQSGGADL